MKIVHVCIANPYVDNWGYQENLLPEYLHKAGTENHIITSNNALPTYLNAKEKEEIIAKGCKYIIGNTTIHKIKCKRISSTMFISNGLYDKLKELRPDVIIHHGIGPTTLPIVSRYAKKHKCVLFADNHADEINMNKNKLWILIYYKFLSRISCRIRRDTFKKFYGVTNSRCEFLNKYFGVPKDKIELLPIGADTDLAETLGPKDVLRDKYGFSQDEKIIVSGGKMGIHKGTVDLINAIGELSSEKIRLILFGKFEDKETEKLATSKEYVTLCGWCDRLKTLELLKLADVACWPIHHTTLIEDCISVETPLIIRKTGTTEHLIDGNGCWLDTGCKEELTKTIKGLLGIEQSSIASKCKYMREKLSYHKIAQSVVDASK